MEQIRSESAARGLQYKFNEQTNWTELLKILKAHENDKKYFKPLINYEYLGGLVLILMWMMARMNTGGKEVVCGTEQCFVSLRCGALRCGGRYWRGEMQCLEVFFPNTGCLEVLPNRHPIPL